MKIKGMKQIGNLLIIILVVLFGCKMTKPYQELDLDAPNNYYGYEKAYLNDTTTMAEMPWDSFFGDSILISLIDTALQNNIDLQIADLYVDIGLARLKQSKANYFPSVGFSPFKYRRDYYSKNYNNWGSNRARRNHGDGNVPTSFYTERLEFESSLDLSWELDIWGKLSAQKRAAQLQYMKTQEFQKAVKTSLISEIASTYFYLALLKAQIDVYNDNLVLNDNTLRIVQLQFEAGEVTSLAVKQTLSQKLRAQTLIPQLEREYIRQENRLNRLLGRHAQSISPSDLELPMVDEEHVVGMPLALLANRPDVAAAEYTLQESYERAGIANAMRYPTINLGASLGLNSFQLDKLLNPAGSGLLLLSGLVYQPIFQKRKLKTNYEIALKEKEIAELKFKDKFIQATNEVSNALLAIDKLKEEHSLAQERVDAAQRALKDANMLFRSGLANYLEVITAQREALDSELNLVSAKMRLLAADVELYRSLGGGWR
ncbi:MAG: multidrug transporter [Flammeovirgaceae bacterium]|nr:multidrug transporter [Flammeovirgaceae bacterium]HCX24647.1 multidrug transporter [Cytophagales bacterium]|tara:strand:+ start:537 stop:1997 length:1461 start_codon:yes stop_codon:yes gene_type:complete